MEAAHTHRPPAELRHLGEGVLRDVVARTLTAEDHGKFIAIAVDSQDFELDQNDYQAVKRLLDRQPGAEIWLARAGFRTAYRIG